MRTKTEELRINVIGANQICLNLPLFTAVKGEKITAVNGEKITLVNGKKNLNHLFNQQTGQIR